MNRNLRSSPHSVCVIDPNSLLLMRMRMLLSTSWLDYVCRERVAVVVTQVLPLKRIALELVSVACLAP